MSALLEVKGLSKEFGAIKAVQGVSLSVAKGEVLGIIGPNGSGKSTLFNAILGQLKPSAGKVFFEGRDVTGLSPNALSGLGIGRTFQKLQVFGGMSVRENLIASGQEHRGNRLSRLFGKPDAGLGDQVDKMIDFFKLGHLAEAPAGDLSFGQQKLLDVAMAFMAEPKLALLDEPAGGINPTMLGDLKLRLKELNQNMGATFVVIEHNMEFVMTLSDRVIVLSQGRVLAVGSPQEIQGNPEVIEAYLGS